jgi:protein O-GlcNAc transferase
MGDWQRQTQNAVEALASLQGQREAPPGIDQALTQLERGNTQAAEAIFQEIKERKAAESPAANKQAAEAARYLGGLALLHDTGKALEAYRQATTLDPDNGEGWNMLGQLLLRTGELSEAEAAFRKVESLATSVKNQDWQARAYGNLGLVYQVRKDLDQAETMHRKALEIEQALGRTEGMANNYLNLGIVYGIRRELERAEAMLQKALEIHEALSNKEGMASVYANLGIAYQTRGDLDQAETMYCKALTLFEAIGAQPQIEQVRAWLAQVRVWLTAG